MNPPGIFQAHPEKLATILEHHRQEIIDHWFSALRQKWTGPAASKLAHLEQKLAVRQDLLSFLIAGSGETEASYQHIAPLIKLDCITSQEYSVLDVCDEAVFLKDSILKLFHDLNLSGDEREPLNSLVHQHILGLMRGILGGAGELLACLVDGGKRGYCQVDDEGRIVGANAEMRRLLGQGPVVGEPLVAFFQEKDKEFISKSYLDQGEKRFGPQRLNLLSHDHKPIPVGIEVCPLVIGGRRRGGYACLVDLSQIHQVEQEVFENLPVGVARVDLEGNFLYVNRKYLEILDIIGQSYFNKTLWDFLPDPVQREKVQSELERRRQGERGEYEATFTRADGAAAPVKIYAVPETDLARNFIGSIAIIRSLARDKAVTRMHDHMGALGKWQDMLARVIGEVKPFIPYDVCIVTEISPDQKHLRRLLAEPPLEDAMSKMGRWEAPDVLTQWLKQQREIYCDGLETFLSRPEFDRVKVKEVPLIKQYLEGGYRSFIRLPIIQDQPVASVTFLSKTIAYDEKHRELLEALAPPLDKAVRLALYQETEEEFKFFFELVKKISAEGKDFRKVAKILVDDLAEHYRWGNVALFRADKDLNRFFLLNQKSSQKGTPPIPEGYEQPLDQGILGYVYRTEKPVNIGNVKEDPKFKDIYVSAWKSAGGASEEGGRSELCLRLATQNACFLLNVEDGKLNAFSDKELNALQVFCDEAEAILERSWLYHSLTAALQSTSDAVIYTDRKGHITSVNRAAAHLLGYTEAELQQKMADKKAGLHLKNFFQDVGVAQKAITDRYFPAKEVVWLNKSQQPVPLLLSAAALPEDFGGKIFTGKDLRESEHGKRLEHLEKLYQEIAIRLKTPLSLAFTWLKRLVEQEPQSEAAKTLGKVIKQLHKVDLTFDRLSLYDYDEQAGWFPTRKLKLRLEEVWRNVQDDLSESDWERILDSSPRPLPTLRGDLFQLTFCVETILCHLLEVMPEDERVQVKTASADDRVVMEFSGVYPEIQDSELSRALAAIALGENLIRRFMANHDGEFQQKMDGGRTVFCLNLPAAKGE